MYITICIVSCSSLKEEPEIKSLFIPTETNVFTSEHIREIVEGNELNLSFSIIFPSYDIIPRRLPLPDDPILRLIELKKRYYQNNDLHQSNFSDIEISAIYSDTQYYYLGSVRGGIFRYSIESGAFGEIKIPYNSIVNQRITGIVKMGNKLFITSFSGLYSYDLRENSLFRELSNENKLHITSLSVGDDTIFLGTADGRLLQWDGNEAIELLRIKNSLISAVLCTEDRVYVGTTEEGVYEYNILTGKSYAMDFINRHLKKGKISFISKFDGKYWLGAAGDGLLVFDEDTGNLLAEERGKWFLSTCHSDNIIYFGTHGDGLLYYDRIKKVQSAWGIPDGLPSLYIPSLFQANGKVYISTPDEGILIISEEIHE